MNEELEYFISQWLCFFFLTLSIEKNNGYMIICACFPSMNNYFIKSLLGEFLFIVGYLVRGSYFDL